nr:hypothetical protein [uncultured Mediterraneibacter sp.]
MMRINIFEGILIPFVGFWIGILFLLALDHLIPHLHAGSDQAEGAKRKLGRTTMMVLAVILHNIPEGMAVGVMYAGFLAENAQITAISALALSLGIAIQNFPAGAMLYVVVEELIPEMSQGQLSNIGTLFFALGFSLMMILDVALG